MSKNDNIKDMLLFEETVLGCLHNQTDAVFYAYLDRTASLGHVKYTIYNGDIYIDDIEVKQEYENSGVDEALMKELRNRLPGKKFKPGALTDKAMKYFNKTYKPVDSELH